MTHNAIPLAGDGRPIDPDTIKVTPSVEITPLTNGATSMPPTLVPGFSHVDRASLEEHLKMRSQRLQRVAALMVLADAELSRVAKALQDANIGELGDLHDDLVVDALVRQATTMLGAATLFGRHIVRRRIRLERRVPLDVATIFMFKRLTSGPLSTVWRTLANSAQTRADLSIWQEQQMAKTDPNPNTPQTIDPPIKLPESDNPTSAEAGQKGIIPCESPPAEQSNPQSG